MIKEELKEFIKKFLDSEEGRYFVRDADHRNEYEDLAHALTNRIWPKLP